MNRMLGRHINIKGALGKGSERNEEVSMDAEGKVNFCIVTDRVVEFCIIVASKEAELISDKFWYLAEENFRTGIEGVTWILVANNKIWQKTR